jgi:hypothetical protein
VPKRKSRCLVIDASVARSATYGENPVSAACRKFLQQLLDICHRVVFTPEIDREWNYNVLSESSPGDKVRLIFLLDWLPAMQDRGKIIRLPSPANVALRRKINRLGLPQASRRTISDDVHLIEAALAGDGVVISRDDEVHRLLQGISGNCREIEKVIWVNPVTDDLEKIEWLRRGARRVKAWQLGSRRH